MDDAHSLPPARPSLLERFGLYYLNVFRRYRVDRSAFEIPDSQLSERVDRITFKGILLCSLVSLACVLPMVLVDIHYEKATAVVHYGWVAVVTLAATAIEFYYLFYFALRAVHRVSELIHMEDLAHESMKDGVFGVKNILARAALELPDPEMKILGIDPFQRISKKNLLVLGLLYKGKIIATNILLKLILRYTVGAQVLGISILYVALPVEVFWNAVVIRKVIREARLRLFGYALANRIAESARDDGYLACLSPLAKQGCLRAIGNAVVMTQNYHPNMVILLLRFRNLLAIPEKDRYDDWPLFLETLRQTSGEERNFLLDLLTVAAAFDGRLSTIELSHLKEAYQDDWGIYAKRLRDLTSHLRHGRLNAAHSLCGLDFAKG